MAVNLADPIPDWTDGTDHWRDADVTWLVDRIVLRVPDRTTVTAGSGNAGKVIYSIADTAPYISVGSVWKSILASTKFTITDTGDPELRLSAQGAGSGIVFKSASVVSVNTLQVSGGATVSGALQTASMAVTANVTIGGTLVVSGSGATISGALFSGPITAPSLTGNAATATKWATARTFSLFGELSGSTSFDGSGNFNIVATVNNKFSSSVSNSFVFRDANAAFAAGGTCQFAHVNISGNAVIGQTLTVANMAINGSVTGSSSINCSQITANNFVFSNGTISALQGIRSYRTGVTGDWTTSHFIADAADNGNAALALKSGNFAVVLRMSAATQDLYFRNSIDSAYVTCQGFFNNGSSLRYKTDIKPLDIDALDVVRQLAPVSWKSKQAPTDKRYVGLVAEAVDEVFPQAVSYDEHGRPESLSTSALDALSLMASAQLLSRIEAIEARLA